MFITTTWTSAACWQHKHAQCTRGRLHLIPQSLSESGMRLKTPCTTFQMLHEHREREMQDANTRLNWHPIVLLKMVLFTPGPAPDPLCLCVMSCCHSLVNYNELFPLNHIQFNTPTLTWSAGGFTVLWYWLWVILLVNNSQHDNLF